MWPVLARVAFFGALFALQCCVAVLGTISRDTIFLRSFGAGSVAALTLLLALTTALALTRATALLASLARRGASAGLLYALAPAALAAGTAALALASLLAPAAARLTSVALYVWLEISAQLLTQQFWDLCAKAFDVAQSKKFFGFITFGSTAGSLLASFVVLPTVQARALPTEFNLLAGAALQLLVAAVLFVSAETFAPTAAPVGTGTSGATTGGRGEKKAGGGGGNEASSTTAIVAEIQGRKYLKHICFFDMLATVVRVLVDNTTLSVLSRQEEDQVKASLTQINAVQSFLMIPMQLASGPFFTRFGVMYGISTLPATVFLFGASTYASNSVYSLIFTRALYNAISLSIFNPARELLWLPFNASERAHFKSFVYGPFRSLSRIFGAVFTMFLATEAVVMVLGASSMSAIMTVAAVAWFVDALAARQSYAAEFYSSLRQGYLDLSSPLVDFTPDQIVLVKETLVAGAQNQVNYVLSSLSHEHIGLFSQELRALFYKKNNRDGDSATPLHTKLRLLSLHTAAKRQFVLHAQESYFVPDASTSPSGIFNTMDLMMMIKDKSLAVPRQLRVAAILACGYERYNADAEQCSYMLSKLVQSSSEDKSVVVCAAVALLRLSDWMDEEANVVLQRLLHEDKARGTAESESRVVCLKIVGKELPELLGDGFLVYLLHHSSPQIVQAAVECCSHSSRNSRMLIPALVKHLSNSALRSEVVAALKWFDPAALWATLSQYIESVVQFPKKTAAISLASSVEQKREALAGALKVLEATTFQLEDKLNLLLSLIDALIVSPTEEPNDETGDDADIDVLHQLFSKDAELEELAVDALLNLTSSTDEKAMHAHSQAMSSIHHALNTKIRQAYEMRHALKLFHQICPRTATNIEETSPLLLQHVEHSLHDTQRLLLKLLSTGFPKAFNVSVILEGLQSDVPQVLSAIQEVLESLLPSSYKTLVLPLLFPQSASTKSTAKMEREVAAFFAGKDGVDILLDVLSHPKPHAELAALALQYFLHIAADHAECLSESLKAHFETSVLPQLVANELTKELLVETYHSRPEVLSYEFVPVVRECAPPLISRIAIANCLRYSSLFESVCAIGILRVLSHHFVPISVASGETVVREDELATAMYVVASGTVQLHKERRIFAELGYGACVGQAALLMHSLHAGKHISSATAVSDCILLSVSRDDLDALMKETPRVSRGVLNAVASSLRWLYFEPLQAIAQSGCLPRRDRTASMTTVAVRARAGSDDDPLVNATETLTSDLRAVLSVDRAAKSFLYNIGRSRSSRPGAPLSAPSGRARNLSFQGPPSSAMPILKPESFPSRGMFGLTDGSDYTTFEKCICLKGSQLMKNLDDDKVSLAAQLSRVITLTHGETLYEDGAAAHSVYVIIDGTISIKHQLSGVPSTLELRDGDCFGEESFVPKTSLHGRAVAVGRVTLFEIPTKDLVDLSEQHHDIMHVILSWMAQKLANATEKMVAPMLSPINTAPRAPATFWESDEESSSPSSGHTRQRKAKSRAETG